MKVKITKIEEREDALHPQNIPVGKEYIKEFPDALFEEPQVGTCFFLGSFRTSAVQEVIDENTVKTHNSIYRWEILERDAVEEERFTVAEFKKYLESQDSRGDIHYNLSAENIRKANQPEEQEDDI